MAIVYLVFLKSVIVYWKYFLCNSSYFFIKSRWSYMFEKKIYGYKRVQGINSCNFFPSSYLILLHNGLIKMVFQYLILDSTCYAVEVVIFNQTEFGAGGRGWLNNFFLIVFLKNFWVSETFLHLIFISSTYFSWSSQEFPFVKNLWKKFRWKVI